MSLGGDFGKPRPAVVIQTDRLAGLDTLIIVPFTTDLSDELYLRPTIEPDGVNGLRAPSQAMVEKLTAVRHKRIGSRIGNLSTADLARIDHVIGFVLGFRDGMN